jgi:hypothetical protein
MASIKGYNVSKTRNALIDSISRITAEELPDIKHVYLPFRQQAALRLRAKRYLPPMRPPLEFNPNIRGQRDREWRKAVPIEGKFKKRA